MASRIRIDLNFIEGPRYVSTSTHHRLECSMAHASVVDCFTAVAKANRQFNPRRHPVEARAVERQQRLYECSEALKAARLHKLQEQGAKLLALLKAE